ncbi:MAG: hypothetical protein DRR08_06770 [Candidatus Parabeggiatoa sp. nov. 2]|nr:MAG: hypothetical protein B6247_12725 [Beggiatoa sp. 4572_84]RKZ62160.1 MAG: hypothetical protein DRR08_06770 [Gammaproteobacteria bacterium]
MLTVNVKFDTLIRFAYIETRLYWEGGLAASELAKTFYLTRQTAQAVINDYRQQHLGQMRYDSSLKRHLAEEDFKPQYIRGDAVAFLDYLRGQNLRAHYLDEPEWSEVELADVDRLLRPKLPRRVVQPILAALRHQQTLLIKYQPVMPDDIRVCVISPNHLVFANNRYHLHAYCHERQKYLDFVLYRIVHVEPADEEWVSSEESREWNEFVTLRFRPNRELPQEVQETVLREYLGSDDNNILEIRCRKNEAFYVRQKLLKAVDSQRGMPLWIDISTEKGL